MVGEADTQKKTDRYMSNSRKHNKETTNSVG